MIIGENYEFALEQNENRATMFCFDVFKNGCNTGHKIRVGLYGNISVPHGICLTAADRLLLNHVAVHEYKKASCF